MKPLSRASLVGIRDFLFLVVPGVCGPSELGSLFGRSRSGPGSSRHSCLLSCSGPRHQPAVSHLYMLISVCLVGCAVCFVSHPLSPCRCLFSPYKVCKSLGAISCLWGALAEWDPFLAPLLHLSPPFRHNVPYFLQHFLS